MTISSLVLGLIIAGSVLITAIITYLWLGQTKISKSGFEELQKQFFQTKSAWEHEESQHKDLKSAYGEMKVQFEEVQHLKNELDKKLTGLHSSLDYLKENYHDEQKLNQEQKTEINRNAQQIIDLNKELALHKASYQNLNDKMKVQFTDFEKLREKSLLEFKEVANTLLEEKSERFARMNQSNIEQILKPLGENLSNFKKQVEETYDKESKQRFSLEEKIKELVVLNNQISEEATNLTNALKGQSKTQGDWGEMILENILEYSGLHKDREYFVQQTFRDESGNLKKPDIIVKYPDKRFIIIDSKVSLVAYERMSKSNDTKVIDLELASHIKSVKNHIDELSAKEYDKFDKTLDFVMLFVPIEPAYLVAMQKDPELWNYAYKKRILLISPTNLIAALKMVADIWKRDDQNKNARQIAKRGEILYEKFVNFVSDLENIEKHISKADESWKEAMSKLKTGRGNLIGQAEKLRKLGLKPKKKLSDTLMLENEEE